ALTVAARRLQPIERLIVAQVLREGAVAEDVAVVSGHGKNGSAPSARLQRHDGALLPGKHFGRTQEFQDILLALLQLNAQLGCQRVRRSITPQPIAVGHDLNIAAAQLGEQGSHAHNSISTLLSATAGCCPERATHARASMASASAETVGRSKRTRSGKSRPEAARNCNMSRAAMSEWPPRSKKLSNTPKSVRPSTPRNTLATISSLGVRGSTATALGNPSPRLGAGIALRSSLPLWVRGSALSMTKWAGTMYS